MRTLTTVALLLLGNFAVAGPFDTDSKYVYGPPKAATTAPDDKGCVCGENCVCGPNCPCDKTQTVQYSYGPSSTAGTYFLTAEQAAAEDARLLANGYTKVMVVAVGRPKPGIYCEGYAVACVADDKLGEWCGPGVQFWRKCSKGGKPCWCSAVVLTGNVSDTEAAKALCDALVNTGPCQVRTCGANVGGVNEYYDGDPRLFRSGVTCVNGQCTVQGSSCANGQCGVQFAPQFGNFQGGQMTQGGCSGGNCSGGSAGVRFRGR